MIFACQPQITGKDELARAFGQKLYKSDITGALATATNSLDSLQIMDKYVDNWLMSEILYNEAKQKIGKEPGVEKLVEDYKKSLYIHELEKKKLHDMDTAMISAELASAIAQSESQYLLEEPYLRFLFVKVNESVYNDTLKSIWKTEDLPALDSYVKQMGGLAMLNIQNWYSNSEFNNITPTRLRDKINFSKTESYSLNQDGTQLLLKILEYKKAGESEPSALSIPKIRQRIMHDKSVIFLKEWKKTLYQNNIQSKNIHINNNQ